MMKGFEKGRGVEGGQEGGNLQVESCSEPVTPDTTTKFP